MTTTVFELRQYTTLTGRRDELIDYFERWFVDSQNAVGARVLGQFRDLDDPERFVWIRGFASMEARLAALTAFYDGPLWKARREAAIATMRDTDNVLLLRPPADSERFDLSRAAEPGAWLVLIHDLRGVNADAFVRQVRDVGLPFLVARGATATGLLVTESSADAFTRLPIRVGDSVVVTFARFADAAAMDGCLDAWKQSQPLRGCAADALLPAFMRKPEVLRLVPTARSAMR